MSRCIIYYGPAISDRVFYDRQLQFRNFAGTSRMLRIAQAVQATSRSCIILSQLVGNYNGVSASYFDNTVERQKGIVIVTLGGIKNKVIQLALAPVRAFLAVLKISRKRKIDAVIQYNYSPDAFVLSIFCKLILGSKIIFECEECTIPSFSNKKRLLRHAVLYVLMKLSSYFADCVMVSSARFFSHIAKSEKAIVVTGCDNLNSFCVSSKEKINDRIWVMLNGTISRENGMCLFVEALHLMDKYVYGRQFQFVVSGAGELDWLRMHLSSLKHINVRICGLLSDEEYISLYQNIDVCLALQDPNGFSASLKTPSKGYEAICHGKLLVVSDIGDFSEIPSSVCEHLAPYTAERLAQILCGLNREYVVQKRQATMQYAKSYFDSELIGKKILKTTGL